MLNGYLKNMSNLPNRSIYCLKCRKKTLSTNVQLHEQNRPKGGEGKQYILKGMCTVCNSKQSQFVSGSTNMQLRMGHGVVNDILNSKMLPELHIPGHKFTGCTGGLTKLRPWRGRCRAGYSNTGGPPLPRKRAPLTKKSN